jgi:inosine-uridine nucleoside N-ribohydrolase
VVATGPLTSVARALRSGNPIDRVVWTGGSAALAGEAQGAPREFNAAADPRAVREVLTAGVGLAVVPIEVTSQVAFTAGDVTAWRSGPSAARLCAELIDRRVRGAPAGPATWLHDPLAVVAAAEPGLFRWEQHTVGCGPDGSIVPDPRGGPALIAVAVHAGAARRLVIDAVAGVTPPPHSSGGH